MAGSIATTLGSSISNILKRVYDNDEATALNNEDTIFQLLGGNVMTEVGEGFYITVHVGRNDSGSNMSENDAFPDPDTQKRVRISTTTLEWGMSGGITFKALNVAAKKGPAAIKSAIAAEVEPAMKDAKQAQCKLMAFGGPSRGLIWEKKNFTAAANAAGTAAGAVAGVGSTTFEYDGDYTPFLNCVAGTPATWVPVTLVRNDRDQTRAYKAFAAGNEVTLAGGATTFQFFVIAINQAAGTITIGFVCDGAGGSATCLLLGGTTAGFAVSVQLASAAYSIGGTAIGTVAVNSKGNPLATAEQKGLLSNLTTTTHFGLDRSGVINGNAAALQSWVWSMADTTPGARTAWDPARVNLLLSEIYDNGGGEPNVMLMKRTTHHTIIAKITTTDRYNYDQGSKKDIGPAGTQMVLGYTPKFSQHIPKGLVYLLKTECWKTFEVASLGFVREGKGRDERLVFMNGNNSYRFYLHRDWEQCCKEPHYQAVLCGLPV